MGRKKHRLSLVFFLILSTIILAGCGKVSTRGKSYDLKTMQIEETSNNALEPIDPDEISSNGIRVSVNYGFNRYSKLGRYMNIRGQITPLEQDFKGRFQIILPEQNGNNVMYEKEIQAAKGETKDVVLDIPMNGNSDKFQYKFITNNGDTTVQREGKVNYPLDTGMEYIGILSDVWEGLDYLQGSNTKAFYLKEDIITDNYLSLDSLDVLVINDFTINKLSDAQRQAIKEWTKCGGTLVLGASGNTEETYVEFLGDSFQQLNGTPIPTEITFKLKEEESVSFSAPDNVNTYQNIIQQDPASYLRSLQYKTIEKDIYNIELTDSEEVDIFEKSVAEGKLLQTKEKGLGIIQIFGFDLRLPEKEQEVFGTKIILSITNNVSSFHKNQILNERNVGSYDYRLLGDLELTSNDNLPQVGAYVIVLIIYIFIAGPIVYIILKKKDKQNYTWGIVPALAVIFTMVVYGIGNGTRVEKPYIGYLNIIEAEEDGSAIESTLFSVTAPNNKPYEISFPSQYNVAAIAERYSYGGVYSPIKEQDFSQYNTSISYKEETIVKIKNFAAFTPVYFTSEDKIVLPGSYSYQINDIDDTVSGTFTNNMEYDLSHTAIMCNGILIDTGDIDKGEQVNLDNLEKEDIPTREAMYGLEIIDKIAGGKDTDSIRRHTTLESIIEKRLTKSSFLVGFIEENGNEQIWESLNYKTYGTTAIVIPLEINQTMDGLTYMNNLEPNMEVLEGYYDEAYRYISSDELVVKYSFDTEDKIKSIRYSQRGNREFYTQNTSKFQGDVYFYNYSTKEYDKTFTSGEPKEITDLSYYLNKNNELLMKVKVKTTAEDRYSITLPMLTAVKEANH